VAITELVPSSDEKDWEITEPAELISWDDKAALLIAWDEARLVIAKDDSILLLWATLAND